MSESPCDDAARAAKDRSTSSGSLTELLTAEAEQDVQPFELRALAPLAAGDGVTYSYAEPRDVRAHFALYGYVPGSACATRSCHVAAYRALARAREL